MAVNGPDPKLSALVQALLRAKQGFSAQNVARLPAARANPPQHLSEVTKLSPEQEQQFKRWAFINDITDFDHPATRYDYRGAFLANMKSAVHPLDGLPHWPDTYKQHGHPTFSVESQYSRGPHDGGSWGGPDGETYKPGWKPKIDGSMNRFPPKK